MQKKNLLLLLLLNLTFLLSIPVSSSPLADGFIPTDVTSLNVEVAQDIEGNLEVVPVTSQWSTSSRKQGFQSRFIQYPMTKNSSGYWEAELLWATDLPDGLKFLFTSGSTVDRNDRNYWEIFPEYRDYRIQMIDPNLCTPRITTAGTILDVQALGPSSITEWKLNLTCGDNPTNPIISSSSNSIGNDWNISFAIPGDLEVGLYDLTLYATAGGKTRSDFEPNSLRILDTIPEDYYIAIFGDQEVYPDGTRGTYNISDTLKELSIVNPLFIVNLGSVSLYGDEPTFRMYVSYLEELCSVPQYMATGHRERFEGGEGDWPYWGMGIAAFERIIGPRNRDWSVGDHFFTSIYPGDHRPTAVEADFIENSLASADTANLKVVFLHDPIKSPTDAPSHIPEQMYEQCVRNEPESTDILAAMVNYGVAYYVHSSIGITDSSIFQGIQHISVTSAPYGYSLIHVQNNAFSSWGTATQQDSVYPLGTLSTSFSAANDGTQTSLIGTITNTHDDAFSNAKITFKMAPGTNGAYITDVGIVESQYTKDGITYVNVLADVLAHDETDITVSWFASGGTTITPKMASINSNILHLNEIGNVKNGDRAGWYPLTPSVGDTFTIWYLPTEAPTTTTTTTTGGATSFTVMGIALAIAYLTVIHKKKR
ncbi:MAG: hypothetical protein EAX86_11345 [Candidatus Heimdallarchaeota archaeon]|nr:hypothetical protein [Candidatus Heimdallarchaeota archaeon]